MCEYRDFKFNYFLVLEIVRVFFRFVSIFFLFDFNVLFFSMDGGQGDVWRYG